MLPPACPSVALTSPNCHAERVILQRLCAWNAQRSIFRLGEFRGSDYKERRICSAKQILRRFARPERLLCRRGDASLVVTPGPRLPVDPFSMTLAGEFLWPEPMLPEACVTQNDNLAVA